MRHPEPLTTKSKTHTVTTCGAGYTVTSGHTGNQYTVTAIPSGFSCSCDWSKYRPAENQGACGCSHVLAVIAYQQTAQARRMTVHTDKQTPRKQHRKILDIGDGLIVATRA